VQNLKIRTTRAVVGVNIGKNKDTPNERAAEDYERCLEALYPHVDYVTLNVSSPNTPGLRDLQGVEALSSLLEKVLRKREALRQKHARQVAVALKISPDLDEKGIEDIAAAARRARIDGLVATNTTTSRAGVEGLPHADEAGGLSGAPLKEQASSTIRTLHRHLQGEIPIIGAGGILCGADAAEKLAAGATLVQIYTGLIYRGPALIDECVSACLARSRTANSGSR